MESIKLPVANNENNNMSSGVGETDKVELTQFENEREAIVATLPSLKQIDRSLLASTMEQDEHDIKRVLARPILIGSDSISTSTTVGTNWCICKSPHYAGAFGANFRDKLSRFLGFRAKTIVRLQINNQTFQAGRILLSGYPLPDWDDNRYKSTYRYFQTIQQLPHVDLDLACASEARLELPYVSPRLFADARYIADPAPTDPTGLDLWWSVVLTIYAPLRTGSAGATDFEFSVWLHFEDIELEWPTLSQGPTEEKSGPVTSMLKATGQVATSLARVPVLSSISKPVSWAADLASNVTGYFGLSKPVFTDRYNRVVTSGPSHMNNSDGIDTSQNLGFFSDNSVQNLPGFASVDEDEMAIQRLISMPTYFIGFTWTTAQTVGTLLASRLVSPMEFSTTEPIAGSGGTFTIRPGGPLCYFGNLFKYWRGSINVILKVMKTPFHSGRLLIAFNPGQNAAASPSLIDMDNLYKKVVDIREDCEVVFNIPWVSLVPYLNTVNDSSGNMYSGRFYVFVLNSLRCPESVSSTIDIRLEASAGDDFEFAVPRCDPAYPIQVTTTDAPTEIFVGGGGDIVAQGPIEPPESMVRPEGDARQYLPKESLGGVRAIVDNNAASIYCIGERVLSIKQLLLRSQVYTSYSAGTVVWGVKPRYCAVPLIGATLTAPAIPTDYYITYFDYFAPCFRLMRGSVRVKHLRVSNALALENLRTSLLNFAVDGVGPQVGPTSFPTYVMDNVVVLPESNEGGSEVQSPQYFRTHCFPITISDTNPTIYVNNPYIDDSIVRFQYANTKQNSSVYRSVGDDFQFGLFVGCPPLYVGFA